MKIIIGRLKLIAGLCHGQTNRLKTAVSGYLWEGISQMCLQIIDLPKPGILLYELKHTDGDIVQEHHHQVHQILYALEGRGKIVLEGKEAVYSQDHVAVIAPNSVHSIVSDSRLTVLVLAFDQRIFDSSVKEELLCGYFGKSALCKPSLYSGSELRQQLRKLLFEQSQGGSLSALAMKTILSELLIVLARCREHPYSNANSMRAERIRHYIDTHYFEILNPDDLSSKQGISTRYINKIFKEQYRITPMQYLTDLRVEMAKKMLAETDKDIVSICFELGFETVSTFYRIFKDTVQMPPNQYRRLMRTQQPDPSQTEPYQSYRPGYLVNTRKS